ncbi:MAG: hypothetical protein HY611_06890, partial [Elusimicrobia bacterium]|nr:hypothetical protein [Elusimicrobiota bacterium]
MPDSNDSRTLLEQMAALREEVRAIRIDLEVLKKGKRPAPIEKAPTLPPPGKTLIAWLKENLAQKIRPPAPASLKAAQLP